MIRRSPIAVGAISAATVAAVVGLHSLALSHDEPGSKPHHIDVPANPTAVMRAFSEGKLGDDLAAQDLAAATTTSCDSGMAGTYPCSNIDLQSFMPLADIGGTQANSEANDIWGWTHLGSGREFAIIGRVFGTSFVEITDPNNPVFLGELPTHGRFGSSWRDIKVFADHAFIVSEARRHGMQVFDLTQLLAGPLAPGDDYQETAHYGGFGSAHNIVINEDTGYAYGVGTNKCSGGLAMVDILDPTNPSNAGCYSADGYTHDAQCVIYNGPDSQHSGKEICFASNEDTLTIVDVTDKASPIQLSRTGYTDSAYTHQGWLTEDQTYFLLDDELDEQDFGHGTRTHIVDVSDLDAPTFVSFYDSSASAIDHNQYIFGNCTFQANYRAGLRILSFDPQDMMAPLFEEGYFDIYPADDAAQFNAAWSNYPYFPSGNVIISGIEQGLYVVKPNQTVLDACNITGTPPNTAPVVNISAPAPGATVSGASVLVDAIATDEQDALGSLTVEWRIAGQTGWNTMTDGDNDGDYQGSWDSTALTDGVYSLEVRAQDMGGLSNTDSISVTTDNGNVAAGVYVSSLESSTSIGRGGKWTATIVATVMDSNGAVSGATVLGSWSAGTSGSGSCVTNGTGTCSIERANISRKSASVTFTIDDVTGAGLVYDDTNASNVSSVTINNPN